MNNFLKAYEFGKNRQLVTIISNKFVRKEDPKNYVYDIYCFKNLTGDEKNEIVRKLDFADIPFKLIVNSTYEIQIKETDIVSFHIKEPVYEDCTKEQLIQLLLQKNLEMQNIRMQCNDLHKSYSKIYHLYMDTKQNNNNI